MLMLSNNSVLTSVSINFNQWGTNLFMHAILAFEKKKIIKPTIKNRISDAWSIMVQAWHGTR